MQNFKGVSVQRKRLREISCGLAIPVIFIALGCQGRRSDLPETAEVTGVVMYQGKPLPEGEIRFIPKNTEANPASGMILPDGTFQLSTYERHDGAAVGQHKVTVNIPPHLDGSFPDPPIQLPPAYGSMTDTPFTADVESGKLNEFEFVIED